MGKEWSCEVIYSLLEKVSVHRVLWDLSHEHYPKKTVRRAAWDKICKELKTEYPGLVPRLTSDSVMGKFAYLMGHYQKLLRKVEKKPSGSAQHKAPIWAYFKALSFLHPVYSSSRNESSFTNEDLVSEGLFEEADLPVAPTLPATTTVLSTTETPSLSFAPSLSPALSPSSSFVPSPSILFSAIPSVPVSSPSSTSAIVQPVPISSPTKEKKINQDELLYSTIAQSLATVNDLLVDRQEQQEYKNQEHAFAANIVDNLLGSVLDSHQHIRREFIKELLNITHKAYSQYNSEQGQ